ncbi:MAG: efflux RND transporter periplasmic adaptor subunit [Alphaproteobacteria bacterium]
MAGLNKNIVAAFSFSTILAIAGIENVSAQTIQSDNLDRGVVKSLGEVTITTDLSASITRMPFRRGQKFQKGDVLIEFDCRKYQQDRAAAQADAKAELANLNSQTEMARHQAAGRNEVAIAQAKYEKAKAVAQALAIRMEQCRIRAPFAGRVAEISAHAFETPQPSAPLLKIIDDANFEIDLIVPSKSLAWLKSGTKFQFRIDETNETYEAVISRFGAAVDPVSQTIEVTAVFLKTPGNILPGMSGYATFTRPPS